MRILILVVALFVVGALCEEKCEPGTTFMEDCNKCRCGADGQKACTRKMCPQNELVEDVQPRTDVQTRTEVPNVDTTSSADEKEEVHLQTNGQVCSPNEIKMKDCNRCRCANNGIGWFCTRKMCPQRETRDTVQKCTPGTTFKSDDGCNNCFCTNDGQPACTLMACHGSAFRKQKRETKQECMPGTTFRSDDDCNQCFCSEDGRVSCTRKACVNLDLIRRQKRETKQECMPGTTFRSDDDCNQCFCTENGLAACTQKACVNLDWIKRQKRDTVRNCEPGTVFRSKDGCNTCFCSTDGHAACTMMACTAEVENKQKRDTTPDSTPRSEIAPGMPGFTCTPGSSFKYQCNTCRCADDGKTAGCSFKYCVPGEW